MRTFKNSAAQGDVYFRRVESMPAGVVEVAPENGHLVISSSETGHHHIMDGTKVKMYSLPDSIMDCFLVVNDPTAVEHLRSYDTHEPIFFERGIYHARRQREYIPEGFRRVQD